MFVWAFLLIVFPIANAIISLIFANYMLVPIFPDCSPPQSAVTLVAATVIGRYVMSCQKDTVVLPIPAAGVNIFSHSREKLLCVRVISPCFFFAPDHWDRSKAKHDNMESSQHMFLFS